MKEDRSLPSYFGYRSHVKKSLQNTIPLEEITDLIATYCSGGLDKEFLLSSFLGEKREDKGDKLLVARRIAKWACEQTDLFLPLGRGNVIEDVISSNGDSYMHAVQARRIVQATNGGIYKTGCDYYTDLMQKKGLSLGDGVLPKAMADFMIRSMQALNFRAGYCHEFASITCQCLLKAKTVLGENLPDGILDNINIIKTGSGDDAHVFIALKVQKNEYSTELLYCDSWARFVGTLTEARMHQVMQRKGDEVYNGSGTSIALPFLATNLIAANQVCYKADNVFELMSSYKANILENDDLLNFLVKNMPDEDVQKKGATIFAQLSSKETVQNIYSQPKEATKFNVGPTIVEIENENDSDDDKPLDAVKDKNKSSDNDSDSDEDANAKPKVVFTHT